MKPTTLSLYKERLIKVMNHLHEHLDEALDPEAIAELSHFSLPHFHRVFKAVTGESLGEHVRRLRLERAAIRLAYEVQPVTRCAFDACYETVESFSRAFKAHFGVSPSAFRSWHMENQRFGMTEAEVERALNTLPDIDVKRTRLDEIHCAFITHIGPYKECEAAWLPLCDWAGSRGLMQDATEFFGICYDDPSITPGDKIRYEACITVPEPIEPDGIVGSKTLPEGPYAHVRHVGPYDHLEAVYTDLMGRWLPHNSVAVGTIPSLEFYRNDIRHTPPDQLITDIFLSLEP
ncbi:AraC family transcriptional regulator [Salidesulfovibrio brasiliensis]|uniref:AraC family transcriptional regulator n=1 Tax=Salidesulfovibrio brasiliensis TaxID=221711 RepID=UPI0009FA2EF7|nr:AraC family transcriptional regulator [Salidesulfovibrio brasiliensis]